MVHGRPHHSGPAPSIDSLPPGEAHDCDYFRGRLIEQDLLARSIAIRVFRTESVC
ncbi:DUF6302 family protein [Streptomyces sp. NPDC006309]|uniref:DUF6302 family protein n=1 Tax=Streptomyces sp. NPDC006309 TaxID=3156749 RepID=UPI0033BC25E6